MSHLDIYIDGAAKGNPGPAGIGIVIRQGDCVLKQIGKHIGNTTNNVAEYTALIYALQEALILKAPKVKVWTDSELVYKQVKGDYRVAHPNIKPLFAQVRHLLKGFNFFEIQHIHRENNRDADKLASKAAKDLR